jgi:hypothetical protein
VETRNPRWTKGEVGLEDDQSLCEQDQWEVTEQWRLLECEESIFQQAREGDVKEKEKRRFVKPFFIPSLFILNVHYS